MYRFLPFAAICLIAVATLSSSCQKDPNHESSQKDSLLSVLPKQIIWTSDNLTDSIFTEVFSIRYDTLNHQIGIYIDDTTNSNPYDRLVASYVYNNSGYLIKATGVIWQYAAFSPYWDNTFDELEITRDLDNKIIYTRGEGSQDSLYYFYKKTSTGTSIMTIFYKRDTPFFNDTTITQYDNNFRILSTSRSKSDATTFEYNPNKSPSKKESSFMSEHFFYASNEQVEKVDLFSNLLLGKDNYIKQISGLYPFQFAGGLMYGNEFALSATNPYHFTHIEESNIPILGPNGQADMHYEFNERKLLSKVTFEYNGAFHGMAVFNY